jgi:predicted  nucleic acid-binding Zn-ribbon protein
MNQKEEIKKYERKIDELHSQVESEAQELGRLQESNESERADANRLRSERSALQTEVAGLTTELSKLRADIEKEKQTKKRGFVEYDSATKKAKATLDVLQLKTSQANQALKQKLKLSKDLVSINKKCDSASARHKAILNSITQSQHTLLKEQQKSKGIVAQAEKVLKGAREKEAQINQGAQSLKKERAKVLFYLRRINRWNKSKGLKEIEITL